MLGIIAPAVALAVLFETVKPGTVSATPPQPPASQDAAPGVERMEPPPPSIDESSGLAASRRTPGALWTCNDSGGGNLLVRYDPRDAASTLGFRLRGVANRDWEDLASFRQGNRSFLLVADTGDNRRARPSVAIHFVEEPAPEADPGTPLPVLLTVRTTYADGARDCEAVAVDAGRGLVLLGSKEIDQHGRIHGASGLYAFPLPQMPDAPTSRLDLLPLARIAELPTLMPTGMDVSGNRLAVSTYGEALMFTAATEEGWDTAVPAGVARVRTPPRRQGEAIAFSDDGRYLFFTSEGRAQPTWRVRVPPVEEPDAD